ncbi:response regulator transcription factor [Sphingobium lignivorans]|uniref:Two-component system OmpR family response regulator n=1 Tax=Sphingobium lignivorans TaxID=2735886 RepID=A0ABR6NDU3_9SPHN|nr:response regulator transcription factor [Sphingobium lignivorans]MBB5985450.1 two-component system OmpR family response regulator [Sphingobium lignivorans]
MDRPLVVSIVEDDADMRILLERFLKSVGMEVTSFSDTSGLDEAWLATPPDVILLDVNLPGESGFMAAARLRARSMVGLVILTGRTAEEDRLLGLSMGVDHYLGKPVNLRELESVIRNLGRRVGAKPVPSEVPVAASEKPGWNLDSSAWLLTAPNGRSVDLSSAEYQVLQSLLEEPGQPQSREALNEILGKPRLGPDNRSLDVLVSRLRRKAEELTSLSFPLRAARGTGYVFAGDARINRKVESGS